MLTLPYGYLLPENTDTGDVFFPAWQLNITQIASHSHNGTDSAPLSSTSASILAAGWAAAPVGGGIYRQAITIPAPYLYDTCSMWFKRSSGEVVYPTIERINGSSFYIYTNDPSLAYTVYYR